MPTGRADAVAWPSLADAVQRTELVSEAFRAPLAGFYVQRGHAPLWFDGPLLAPRSDALRMTLARASLEGLNPAEYLTPALRDACAVPVTDPVACELRLSDSLLRYARDVGYGLLRVAEMDPNWHIPQAELPVAELLEQVARGDDLATVLEQLPPPHAAYRRLRAALADYRQVAPSARWFSVPPGASLRPGERDGRVLALRERLGSDEPALLDSADAAFFDAELEAAVLDFQIRHGLDEDGIVGPKTVAALNVTRAERIVQLRVNMERWRWLPRELGESHILVNLAGFDLTLVQPDQPDLRMRAINGRTDRTSPAFASRISRLVLNPDWTVPRRIAVEDMLPQLQRDAGMLREKAIEVLQWQNGELVPVPADGIDWRRYDKDNFPFVLRQAPGPGNSLGRIKFVMSNPFTVYIHDTPARYLFERSVRAFSSGCIRVEQALPLATRLLGDPPPGVDPGNRIPGDAVAAPAAAQDTGQWLRQRIDQGETEDVPLPAPTPVYLVYLTAWVDDAGNLAFRNDVYGRNVQMRDRFAFP